MLRRWEMTRRTKRSCGPDIIERLESLIDLTKDPPPISDATDNSVIVVVYAIYVSQINCQGEAENNKV